MEFIKKYKKELVVFLITTSLIIFQRVMENHYGEEYSMVSLILLIILILSVLVIYKYINGRK
tara:strand:+ start:331 stop:516 length:186 start_codon:yes stop_codon:yes gene_type:complete